MTNMFLVMSGGAIGTLARYLTGRLAGLIMPGAAWPWGTFAVNLIGGFAMGLLAGWLARGSILSGEPVRLLLGVGVLGGFTTFSAFSLDTMMMIERGQVAMAMGYAVVSVIGAVGALALGLNIMRSVVA